MLSDIEIAQQANMKKITEVAASLGISEDDIEPYGHYKAKLSEALFKKLERKPNGKLFSTKSAPKWTLMPRGLPRLF